MPMKNKESKIYKDCVGADLCVCPDNTACEYMGLPLQGK